MLHNNPSFEFFCLKFKGLKGLCKKSLPSWLLFICMGVWLSGCQGNESHRRTVLPAMQELQGRESADGRRHFIYRMRVPEDWIQRLPLSEESLIDTTKPLCEFFIRDEERFVRIAIHNFPSLHIEDRVPPAAQVARWQRQFETLAQATSTSQAFNGYVGLCFKGQGRLKGEDAIVWGWSLQLAPEHYRMLAKASSPLQEELYRQMRADVTIKASGSPKLMEKHAADIEAFIHSFELIEEIPRRL